MARRPGSAGPRTTRTRSCATTGRSPPRSRSARRSRASCRRMPGTSCRRRCSANGRSRPPAARTSTGMLPCPRARSGTSRRLEVQRSPLPTRSVPGPATRAAGNVREGVADGHAGLHHPPTALDRPGHGARRRCSSSCCCICRPAIRPRSSPATTPRRCRSTAIRKQPRPRRSAARAVLAAGPRACSSGDLGISIFSNEPVGNLDRPAHRADAVARLHHHPAGGRTLAVTAGVLAAWKAGTWIDRAGHDPVGRRLLGAGVRGRLPADLRVRDQAALAAGAGLHADRRGSLALGAAPRSCRRSRSGSPMSR